MIHFKCSNKTSRAALGLLPMFFSDLDPRSARDQLHENYAHGGGVHPFIGFDLVKKENGEYLLEYKGDPPMHQVAIATLREELIVLFKYSWVAIIQPDETHLITRVD